MGDITSSRFHVCALPVVAVLVGFGIAGVILWEVVPVVHRPTWGVWGLRVLFGLSTAIVLRVAARFTCTWCGRSGGYLFARSHECAPPAEDIHGEIVKPESSKTNPVVAVFGLVLLSALGLFLLYLFITVR